jgi:Cdc6-like AAA superfamily ATPase
MTRLQKIRAYMAKMNPVKDPAEAIKSGLYIQPPGKSLAQEIAQRLEVEPDSTHVIIGGIGSGKTTELLRIVDILQDKLHDTADVVAYIDVSQEHSLDTPRSGVLVALVGKELSAITEALTDDQRTDELEKAESEVSKHIHGFEGLRRRYENEEPEYDEGDYEYHPGVLKPPIEPVPFQLQKLVPHLITLKQAVVGKDAYLIFAFDSLDRLASPDYFAIMVRDDLRVLKEAGIGVVVAAPIRLGVGDDRAILSMFNEQHFQLANDPNSVEGREFLHKVLRARADTAYLPDEVISLLSSASGGVLRDLLSLAKSAGSHAYEAGHDHISLDDARQATKEFGQKHALGLDKKQIYQLKNLQPFFGVNKSTITLIETGCILLYKDNRWVVHPALVPFLDIAASPPRLAK